MATKKTTANPEFLYIPVEKIVVLEQVRSSINIETESFKSLTLSIKDKGILEPLIVTAQDDGTYLLICGERRLVAARQLGLESVPVRIIEAGRELGETIALQLTENLQREDLNPIDQAKGILAYIQAKHPDKGYDVDGAMKELVVYERRPEDLIEEIRVNVTQILNITGKSIKSLYNGLSLLKLPPEIQAACPRVLSRFRGRVSGEIKTGNLPLSQGYENP